MVTEEVIEGSARNSLVEETGDRLPMDTRLRNTPIGDALLYVRPVGDMVRRPPVSVLMGTAIRAAALVMAEENISSLVVVDSFDVPVGILTDRDLRDKVVARGRDTAGPVDSIMSSALIKADATDHAFDALLKMLRHGIHHLLVVENGTFKGVVTNHDFMALQGASATSLIKKIEQQQTMDGLAGLFEKTYGLVCSLLADGIGPATLTSLITEITERTVNRAMDLVEKAEGPPPVPYCLFIYGDGGRRELTLTSRVKLGIAYDDTIPNANAIQYDDTTAGPATGAVRPEQYFKQLSATLYKAIGQYLPMSDKARAGEGLFEFINGFSGWRQLVGMWASAPFTHEPDEGLLEMRAIRGDVDRLEGLREMFFETARGARDFIDYVATKTVGNRPPLGFLKKFVVEKAGEHVDELSLHQKGIRPITDSLRLFSLKLGIKDRSSAERLRALEQHHGYDEAKDVQYALDYLFSFLIQNEVQGFKQGSVPNDFLNPVKLGALERKTLKDVFQLTADLYEIIERRYRTLR